jgi:hypothetical protein
MLNPEDRQENRAPKLEFYRQFARQEEAIRRRKTA